MRKRVLFAIVALVMSIGLASTVFAQEAATGDAAAPAAPAAARAVPTVEPPAVTYGEIVSIDSTDAENPVISVKDRRTKEVNQIVVKPRTRVLKTVNLKIDEVNNGEFARVIYRREEDGTNVARIVFVREAIAPARPTVE